MQLETLRFDHHVAISRDGSFSDLPAKMPSQQQSADRFRHLNRSAFQNDFQESLRARRWELRIQLSIEPRIKIWESPPHKRVHLDKTAETEPAAGIGAYRRGGGRREGSTGNADRRDRCECD